MGKKIAFIGSSGGNLYKQGGNNLPAMMKEICGQTKAADMEITFVQYVLASGSLDNVGPDSPATLYTWNGTEVQAVFQGTLTEVNVEAEKVDAKLAKKIDDGEIDGVMFVSASPDGANRQAMEACARTKIPMVPERAEVVSRLRRTWDVMFCQHLEQQEQRIVQEPLHLRQHLQNTGKLNICQSLVIQGKMQHQKQKEIYGSALISAEL
ncbi:MAG: hypothetical protein ACLT8Y_09165 [Dorea formicigenerans]